MRSSFNPVVAPGVLGGGGGAGGICPLGGIALVEVGQEFAQQQ